MNLNQYDITEGLFQAIDTIIAERVKQLPYDNTDIVTIIDASNSAAGIYKVSMDGNFEELVYSDNPTYQIGDKVYLLKIQDNQMRFIIGLYENNNNNIRINQQYNTNYLASSLNLHGFNYVNTLEPVKMNSSGGRKNAVALSNGIRLTYRDNIDTYFTLQLAKALEKNQSYTLSFNCANLKNVTPIPSFKLKFNETVIVKKYELQEGKNVINFSTKIDNINKILFDDIGSKRPSNVNIELTNFQIEDGNLATLYSSSLITLEDEIKRIETLTRGYENTANWSIGLIDETFLYGSRTTTRKINFDEYNYNVFRTDPIYFYLPYPMKTFTLTGSCDGYGAYISNVSQLSKKKNNDYSVILGTYFKGCSLAQLSDINVKFNLQISGLIQNPPKNTDFAYDPTIGNEIVNIAETYIDSQKYPYNQKYSYGRNFFYDNENLIYLLKNNIKYARMECDTFSGLVLRGIPYSKSPFKEGNVINTIQTTNTDGNTYIYATGDSIDPTLYTKLMNDTDTSDLPNWAKKIREKLQSSTNEDVQKYLGEDARWASTHAWVFWSIPKTIFSDESQAQPGDVAFFRSPQTSDWFDGITHIAIVGERDADGYLTIYEVTGSIESGDRIVQHVSLKNRISKPDYFARPYGWY